MDDEQYDNLVCELFDVAFDNNVSDWRSWSFDAAPALIEMRSRCVPGGDIYTSEHVA